MSETEIAPDLLTPEDPTPDLEQARNLIFPNLDQEEPEDVDPPADPPADEDEPNPDEEPLPAAVAYAALAERAGLSAEDLDAVIVDVEGADEPVTLGELRNQATQEFAGLARARVALDEQRESFERDMITSQQELQRAIAMAGPALTPEIIQAAQAQAQAYVDNEREQMVGIKPEWANPEAWNQAHRELGEFAARFGFTQAEIEQTHDHRLKYLAWAFKEQTERIEAGRQQIAEQTARTSQKDQGRRSRGNAQRRVEKREEAERAAATPARQTGGFTQSQVSQAAALINQGKQK